HGGTPDLVAAFDYARYQRPIIPPGLIGQDFSNPSAVSDAQILTFLGPMANTSAQSLHGDANNDGQVGVADVFYLVNFLFAGGPAPTFNGDENGDGSVGVNDIFYLISFLFAGGPAPR